MERGLRLPPAFRERLALQLGEAESARVLAALGEKHARVLRVNRSATTPADLGAELAAAGFEVEPAPKPFGDALVVRGGRLRDLQAAPAHVEGRFHLQSLACMSAVLVLDPQPGESILDLSAAPGAKAGQIAHAMQLRGRLVANERGTKRAGKLRAALAAQGVDDFVTLATDKSGALARREAGTFDRVLVAAPSSSEARFHLDQETSWADWKPSKLSRLASDQRKLLMAAVSALRPGGVLVYWTDTFAPEENEVALHKLLRRFDGELDLVPPPVVLPGERPALTRWADRNLDPRLKHARLLLPRGPMDGGFVARLEKAL
ncbi:MAG: RsmB/NOP family class I SAM-dependent RNA methyltransferase [Planctomycetes bacterium]|nr:RsmB/NOP family class I SAM-dependent RNA methyltransferase [Planctomycetota bacterium]MCB9904683.1 RsmB/NOP family class I SAM-dependent RNA methyltransferase [Planctomycetota bacterium]